MIPRSFSSALALPFSPRLSTFNQPFGTSVISSIISYYLTPIFSLLSYFHYLTFVSPPPFEDRFNLPLQPQFESTWNPTCFENSPTHRLCFSHEHQLSHVMHRHVVLSIRFSNRSNHSSHLSHAIYLNVARQALR